MCLLKLFRKKKKQEEPILTEEELRWNKMWDLWVEGKMESPYNELMDYFGKVSNGGHHCHFDNTASSQDLGRYVEVLMGILPEPLKSNLKSAYDAYISNPDDVSEQNVQILDSCDSVYYANEEKIQQILTERAKRINL